MKKETKEIKSNKNALLMFRRIIKIDYLLANDAYPSYKQMENDFDIACSRATVMRVIEFMRNEMQAPIAYDKTRNGYFYTNKTFRLPMQFMSEKEMEAVSFLDSYVEKLQGTPVYEATKTILDMLKNKALRNPHEKPYDIFPERSNFDFSEDTGLDWMDSRLVVLDEKHKNFDVKIWDSLQVALKKDLVITFDLYFPSKKTTSGKTVRPVKMKVSPYQIVCSDFQWFLWGLQIGKKSDNNRLRLFRLSEIDNLVVTKEKFELPKEFDYRKLRSTKLGLIDDLTGFRA